MELTDESCISDSSPFVTSLVLYSLNHASGKVAGKLINRGLAFLGSQKEPGGLWRYYSSRQWKHCRVPPDLDDTSCVSFVLRQNGHRPPDNRWIFSRMRNDQGLFRTWIKPPFRPASNGKLWLTRLAGETLARLKTPGGPAGVRDNPRFRNRTDPVSFDELDPVVNANVILYLGETTETAAAIRYLGDYIRAGVTDESSVYYPDPLALYYMTARAFLHSAPGLGELADVVVRYTIERQHADGSFGTPLATALAACVLLTFDSDNPSLPGAIAELVSSQREKGDWMRYALYRGPAEFWGSEELTTGFCLEALARYRKLIFAD